MLKRGDLSVAYSKHLAKAGSRRLAAAVLLLSFSVVAESTVPPTFAIAAAFTLVRASPVNAVSGVCPALPVVLVPVVLVVFVDDVAPNATVAPTSAHTASAAAPIEVFRTFRVMNILPSSECVIPSTSAVRAKRVRKR